MNKYHISNMHVCFQYKGVHVRPGYSDLYSYKGKRLKSRELYVSTIHHQLLLKVL